MLLLNNLIVLVSISDNLKNTPLSFRTKISNETTVISNEERNLLFLLHRAKPVYTSSHLKKNTTVISNETTVISNEERNLLFLLR